jgi:large repetitive protein
LRHCKLVLGFLAVIALPLQAANILTRTGTPEGFWMASAGQTEVYVSWNQGVGTAFSGVTASLTISSSNGLSASGSVYITNAVGPGATAANIIAGPVTISTSSLSATSVPIPFAGTVNLPQGATYFLVVQASTANFQVNFANPPSSDTTSVSPLVTENNDGLAGPPATSPAYNASFSGAGSPSRGILVTISGNPPADLSISKTAAATATAGNNIVYTTTVANAGPGNATGTSVADTTPANLTFVSNSGACTTAFPCSLGTISSGGSAIITSTYTINPAFTGSISNTATVSTTAFDLAAGNNSSTASTTVSASTDVAITKTAAATATAGNNIVYTVTVTNNGPSTATGVSVADTTPANLTFVSNSGGCTTAYPCAIGTLAPGASSVITSTYTISPAFTGSISNTATVSSTTTDPTPGNNSATASTTVSASTDVSITKTANSALTPGSNISYTVTVTNNGPSTATGVSVADTTPSGLTFVSNSGGCTTAYPCAIGTLAPGASSVITSTYSTSPTLTGTVTNTATVSSTTSDPTPGNNSASSVVTAGAASTDLGITKTGAASASAGNNITYTVTVTNNGPSTATGVSVADTTPANLTFVSNSGDCTTAYPCALGTLAPGGSAVISSTYTINPAFTGSITNTATVSATTADPTPGNNSASASTTVGASANLSITKTGAASAAPNADLTYTITVNNAGPSSATSVSVSDTLPAGVTFVSATPSQGSCSGTTTVTCSLGTLANAATATVSLTVHTIVGTAPGTVISNTATVSSAVADPTPGNNTSTASTTVGPATIPTLSTWGLVLLGVLLAACGAMLNSRKRGYTS